MISTFFRAAQKSRPDTTEPDLSSFEPDLSSFASDFTQLGSTDFSTLSTVAPLVSSFPIVPGAGDSGFSIGPGADNLSGLMTFSAGLAGSVATGMSTVTNSAAQPFAPETITYPGSGLVFVNTYSANVTAAYRTAIIAAENFFQGQFTNSVTLNVNFDFGPTPNGTTATNAWTPLNNVSYSTLRAALQSHATTPTATLAVNSLPSTDPTNGRGFSVAMGLAKILELPGAGTDLDNIVLNSNLSWTFGQDVIGTLEHEISEGAMGRLGGLGIQNSVWAPMDLFRYSAPGQRDFTGGADGLATFFSVNGTNLVTQLPFHNSVNTAGVFDGADFADWDVPSDAFGFGGPGIPGTVSPTDLSVMRVLGWTSGNFTVSNLTTSITQQNNGTPYTGPVAGLLNQYINASGDPLNVTANVANSFIVTGRGNDAIDVSQVGGINVLDGATSSNFLVGGTGVGSRDTFFVDDRNAPADIWSTVVNFHVGDSATVWGITPTGFTQNTVADQGAPGFTGLTLQFIAAGAPTASLTLAGYGLADLTNGRLTTSFGTTPDGTPYFNVAAT